MVLDDKDGPHNCKPPATKKAAALKPTYALEIASSICSF